MPTNAEILMIAQGMQDALKEINEAIVGLERSVAALPRCGRLCVEVASIANGRVVLRFGWVGNDDSGPIRDYAASPATDVGGRIIIGNAIFFLGGDDDADN